MNKQVDIYSPDDVINLVDIWKKLVQHKRIFWSVFFAVFIVGGTKVLLTPPKYGFSQVIEIGKSPDERGQNTINVDLGETIKKIKKVFYPAAVRAYNLQTAKKVGADEKTLVAENVGNGALLLSMNGTLKDFDRCKFVLHKIVEGFSNDTREYIDYRRKTLSDAKLNLERRLVETNNFYKAMTAKYFEGVAKKKDMVSVESRIITMYLNDQNSLMIQLSNNINMLQAQIMGTYNTRVISDLIISDKSDGPSKFVLLILTAMVALFSAFFAVFVVDFIRRC
ncbi:conserved hypothetical protein [Gammaproteobacteria bacterium]